MRPKELIPILAETYGVQFETAWVLDRALADAGMRTKSKGRKPLDMTRRDGIHFLLASMSASIATRAVEDVKYWASFTWKPYDPECKEVGSAEKSETAHQLMAIYETVEESHAAYKEYPLGYKEAMCNPLRKIANKDGTLSLVDYLLLLTRWLVDGGIDASDVKFEIVTTHDTASVTYQKPFRGEVHTDHFIRPRKAKSRPVVDVQTGIHKGAYVYGEALLAIAARTDDPLGKVASE